MSDDISFAGSSCDQTERKLDIIRGFWKGSALDSYPVSFRIGDYFFADKFKAATHLLIPGLKIEPEMLNTDEFMDNFEKIYHEHQLTGQPGFWTAEPFTAIPWMEAIFGCSVYGEKESFSTNPVNDDGQLENVFDKLDENPWYQKYMEFTSKLNELSDGRFPVGQPIMRGIADVMGAVLGQTRLIYEMIDNPSHIHRLAHIVLKTFIKIIEEQYKILSDFNGGFSIGFYHIWTPDRCIWFQDDLTALLSPGLYREFVMPHHIKISKSYAYSLIHLHPSSFHIIEDILNINELKAVEINKDVGGPSISEMLPILRMVLEAGKRLVLWGTIDDRDMEAIKSGLPHHGIYLNIVTASADAAKNWLPKLRHPFHL
jgi:hypothetical protein